MKEKRLISFKWLLIILALFFAPFLPVRANESITLLESRVLDQSIVLYTKLMGSAGAQARIASETVADVTIDGQDGTLPITTWLLLDNSVSIKQSDRTRAKELLTDLISARAANEVFTLCTFSDHLNPILWETQDYSDLKQAIDGIQHYNQETYLTDCLDELLDIETERTDARYVRVVVISDGVDNNPGGITRDELEKKLEGKNFPIYSVGCTGNAQELKEMYAISRQTGANYWALSEAQNYDITHAMSGDEVPMRITIPIPASLCDGATRGVQVSFEDGTTLQTQIDMPFGAIISPTVKPTAPPTPTPTPTQTPPPKETPEPLEPTAADWMREHWLLIVILALVIVALAIGGYLFIQRKKSQPPTVVKEESASVREETAAPPRGSIFLGRVKEGNDIVIDNPLVSKSHCAIFVNGNSITVYDLGSLNGTLVDDVKLEKGGNRTAQLGSTLTVADTRLKMDIRYVSPDLPSYADTVIMNPDEVESGASGEMILRLTDLSRRDVCYEVPLTGPPNGNARTDGTVYMGRRDPRF